MDIPQEVSKAYLKAKIALMQSADSAFFTTVLFSLKHQWDYEIPTACTNGISVKFNPDFFMSLDAQERVFLLLHEAMHVAYLHIQRGSSGKYEPKRFNIAADHVINLMLKDRGFFMPKGGLADPQYRGMSTEEVYALLEDSDTSDFEMDIEPMEGDTESHVETVNEILVRASVQSKMDADKQGTIPGEIAVFIDKLINPTLPWNQILKKYLFARIKEDYSWSKPNKRFFPEYYLPTLYSEGLGEIAIAVDTSGSVSDGEFSRFVSEIKSILKKLKPTSIKLIQFDTKITDVVSVKNVNQLDSVVFTGRGGTCMNPVIEYVTTNKPKVLLVFTDGHFGKAFSKPPCDVVWLIHNNPTFTINFGKVIRYEIK